MDEEEYILLIETDLVNLKMLERVLTMSGYTVKSVRDPGEAIEFASQHPPTLIVANQNTPGKGNGRRTLYQILKRNPDLKASPFLLMCEHGTPVMNEDDLFRWIDDYIFMPYQREELLARVRNLMWKRHQLVKIQAGIDADISGRLATQNLTDILQLLSQGRRSGRVEIFSENRQGSISLRDGELVTAHFENEEGEKAVYQILKLTKGIYRVFFQNIRGSRKIHISIEALLLELFRDHDESQRT